MTKIALTGIPYDAKSSFMSGAALAPRKLFEELMSTAYNDYSENMNRVLGTGDVLLNGHLSATDYNSLFGAVRAMIGEADKHLFIGGDHSVTYPILKAYHELYGSLNILHFDAHSDLYPEFEGDLYSHACPFARILEDGLARSLIQVGVRTMTPEQKQLIEKHQVEVFPMQEIAHFDPSWLESPLYVSVDIDVLDPAFAPGVAHRESGGMSPRRLIDWLQQINARVVGADLVEYNPLRDIGDLTASTGYKLIKELLDLLLRT